MWILQCETRVAQNLIHENWRYPLAGKSSTLFKDSKEVVSLPDPHSHFSTLLRYVNPEWSTIIENSANSKSYHEEKYAYPTFMETHTERKCSNTVFIQIEITLLFFNFEKKSSEDLLEVEFGNLSVDSI